MKTIYDPGWGVVWRIYSKENLKKSHLVTINFNGSIFCCLFLFKKNPLGLIEYVGSTILSVGPNMLGFTLSGYALMMGLSNSEFIQGLINFREEGKRIFFISILEHCICCGFRYDVFDYSCRCVYVYYYKSGNITA